MTKRDLVGLWVRKTVRRAVLDLVGNTSPGVNRDLILAELTRIEIYASGEARDMYAFLELEDIMKWRKRRVGE